MKKIINKIRRDSQVRFGYGTAFFLLMVSFLITLYANQQLIKQAKLVDHSNKIIYHIESMLSSLKDGETGARGYMIMKDQKFLGPYFTSKQNVDTIYRTLLEETKGNFLQSARLDTLIRLINSRYEDMYYMIKKLPATNFVLNDSITFLSYEGRIRMEQIRSLSMRMQMHEENLLQTGSKVLTERSTALNTIIVASLFLAFLLLFLGFLTYLRENKERRVADEKVAEYQSQLKQQIEQLAEANKELIQVRSIEKFAATGRIARTIAHEVRNPLTNINLAIEQIKSDMPSSEDNLDILFDMVTRNSNRINHLITDLLNSTKFSELDYNEAIVGSLMDDALELAKDRLSLYNIKVKKSYVGTCTILADGEKIKIAFLNIIVNAIESMQPGKGILQLSVSEKNKKCTISITDNGSGMDEEALSRLFEPYFTNKIKGNGLGLTNTQNIILNHKGNISVESEVGTGTTFFIKLDAVS